MRLIEVFLIIQLVLFSPFSALGAATITVNNLDTAGEGFNDPSAPHAASTAGGNTGATLGAQRLIAFQHAANIWATFLTSPVEIKVDANFNPLSCTATSAVLAATGPTTAHRDFVGAPLANTWYAQALANSLAATDLAPSSSDIVARLNSSIGTTCPFPMGWYYGLDGNPPAGTIDFVTVALHELAHGLGFLTFVDLATGARLAGLNDAYMLHLESHSTGKFYPQMTDPQRVSASTESGGLHWVGPEVMAASGGFTGGVTLGGHVEVYAPNPQEPGSSVSHFNTSLTPNQLMEPFYVGPNHDVGLALEALADLGWNIAITPEPPAAGTDDIAPAPVTDLAVLANDYTSVSLGWIAPGDDGSSGRAASYDLRYSPTLIREDNWPAATSLGGVPAPNPAGSSENVTVSGLACGKTYYLGLKTSDEVGNVSPLSNVVKTITQSCPRLAISGSFPTGEVNVPYNASLDMAGGVAPYNIQVVAGGLPSGLALDGTALQGTPAQAGKFGFTLMVTDQVGATLSRKFKVTILSPPSIATATLKAGTVNRAYSAALKPAGGMKPYSWSPVTLPDGLNFDTSSGRISGVPMVATSVDVTFEVSDPLGGTGQRTLTLTIN